MCDTPARYVGQGVLASNERLAPRTPTLRIFTPRLRHLSFGARCMSSEQAGRIQAFLTTWEKSGASELANAQSFINDLCHVLEVDSPHPSTPDEHANAYVFNKTIPGGEASKNFIDCYKRGCFILETKQGADAVGADDRAPVSAEGEARHRARKTGHGKRGTRGWDTAMEKARNQAENYARRLPKEELTDGLRPPFLLVVDVGHSIALYADWTRAGGHYAPFPDPASYRIPLKDLHREDIRTRLKQVWGEPLSLDPSRRAAKVTREIAQRLGQLALRLELGPPGTSPAHSGPPGSSPAGKPGVPGHRPEEVSSFLMRCLFTMFAEDVDLLPMGSFTKLLGQLKKNPDNFVPALESLWGSMNTGGFSPILTEKILRFNGGLFAKATALPLDEDSIQLLIEASTANWKDVEPAIFGTLLERALNPTERHKLGAHYTPRAYVERLVNPTVIEPLRAEWESVKVAVAQLVEQDKDAQAIKEVEAYLHKLATLRILDPACGSGNFLYVTLELLKRLEGEVINTLHDLGAQSKLELEGVMVTPENFFGIEVNPRAADIAEQVLWIGFLQWHLRTHGHLRNLQEPIIKDLHNIEKRDAVLAWDSITPLLDEQGKPVTRWDGRTTKPHPVTGEEVPDADARVPVYHYHKPRPAEWPKADYIVGNPPFIGTAMMRDALGDGYTEALRSVYENVPDSADFVMCWWDKAAELVRNKKALRFGFITTNSLRQTFNRKVLQHHMDVKKPISLAFAIPDHPWVDSADGAAVRVAMTVGIPGTQQGSLQKVVREIDGANDDASEVTLESQAGKIFADLTTGTDVAGAMGLHANEDISSRGVQVIGAGFIVTPERAKELGLGRVSGLEKHLRLYRNGRDIAAMVRDAMVIDLFGLSSSEVKDKFPEVYQHVAETVKPERDQNNRPSYRDAWWIHGEPRKSFRPALTSLKRYITTPETAKHRFFVFLDQSILPDNALVNIALDDAYFLGVLSSRIHVTWALAAGGRLGVGNDPRYNKTRCFETFPFPAATEGQQAKIRALGEQLDGHRKKQQAAHPELTMTDMYNVLERVHAIEHVARATFTSPSHSATAPLTAKEKKIYEQGLIGILKQLHDELDAAVAEAYGWPANLSTDEILTRLVALNAERAAEEANGQVRWLRPEYQNPQGSKQAAGKQAALPVDTVDPSTAPTPSTRAWPNELPAQAAALTAVLEESEALCTVKELAAHFEGRTSEKRLREMEQLLATLAAVGRARKWKEKWAGV